jgi:hypothetical protein
LFDPISGVCWRLFAGFVKFGICVYVVEFVVFSSEEAPKDLNGFKK